VGLEKLREASETHVSDITELFRGRFSREELKALGGLLERLPRTPRTRRTTSNAPREENLAKSEDEFLEGLVRTCPHR
jgi:hypothetical protein